MESSNQSGMTVNGAKVHKISITTRKKLDQGTCKIYQQAGDHFFKVNTFIHTLKNMVFGQVKYTKSHSFFWYEQSEQGFIYVLSISSDQNSDQQLKQFHYTLQSHAVVKDLITMQPDCELYKRVKQAYPQFQTKQVSNYGNAFTKLSKQVGGLAGAISELLTKPALQVGDAIVEKKEELVQSKVGQGTKSKWDVVKQKASLLNDKLTESIKPVADLSKNVSNKIGHSFNHSENAIVKAVRDISNKTKDSLNEGYNEALKHDNHNKPLPAESDSVLEVNVKKIQS